MRTGAATLMIGSKTGEAEPTALDLRYQVTIVRTARECQVNSGIMTMKVGIEGRVITGPAGGPGTIDLPLRLAVVQEGVKATPSRLATCATNTSGRCGEETKLPDGKVVIPGVVSHPQHAGASGVSRGPNPAFRKGGRPRETSSQAPIAASVVASIRR